MDGRFCLLPLQDYIDHSNQERILILQIESPEGLEHVEDIAAVPGVNGLLFGPGDYSHRLGKPGQVGAPEVIAARKRVAAAACAHGKFAMAAGLIAPFAELVEEGHSVFGIGADVVGLANYITERVNLMRGFVRDVPEQPPASRYV